MPEYIHSRQTPEGSRFRIWSTVTDSYTSAETDEEQLRLLLIYRVLEREFQPASLSERIERTKLHGTSQYGATRSKKRWDKEYDDSDGEISEAFLQEYIEGTVKLKAKLESLLAHWDEVTKGYYSE